MALETGTIEDAIYRLNLLKAVAEGLEDAEKGREYDHDEVFEEILKEDGRDATTLDARRKTGSRRATAANRSERAKKSARVRQKAKSSR